ncbi:MAG: lytic transglycosylase domain-containing protein [Pseudomonadota bacterium]
MKLLPALLTALVVVATSTVAATPLSASPVDRRAIQRMIIDEARRQSFPPEVALGVAKVESNYQPDVVSYKGAIGVMQIMPRTGRNEFGLAPHELYDPQTNIRAGVRFLNSLYKDYGRMDIALSHYNGGSSVRQPSGELQIIPATRSYVHRVLELARGMQRDGRVAALAGSTPRSSRGRGSIYGNEWSTREWRPSRTRPPVSGRRPIYGADAECDAAAARDEYVSERCRRLAKIREWESVYRR